MNINVDELRRRLRQRGWSVDENTGCWNWSKGRDKDGYGRMGYAGRTTQAHRMSYLVFNGLIPDGHHVLHTCDNPPCVNPDHLRTGTAFDNMRDMVARGRRKHLRGEDNPQSRLTREQARQIRVSEGTAKEVARLFDVSETTVWLIRNNRSWREGDE